MSPFEKLPTRPLGKNGPELPRLGLGLMVASGVYGIPPADKERFAFLDEAYKRGETFWDTGKLVISTFCNLKRVFNIWNIVLMFAFLS